MNAINDFLVMNWLNLLFSIIGVAVAYVAYKILSREINRLTERKKLEENVAYNLNRLFKWLFGMIAVGVVIAQFGFDIGLVAGFLALAGGTIIGFASMNTIGNAIAGL